VDATAIAARAVPDLLLGNLAGAGFCRIYKANPAGARAELRTALIATVSRGV